MTLQQLRYILAVERHLNFNQAAKSCGVSQPSLSTQVKALEEELRVTLFDRSTKAGVRVTDIGKIALHRAKNVIAEMQRLEDDCQSFRGEIRGVLRAGFIPTVGPYLLPLFLETFKKTFPLVALEIIEDNTFGLIRALREDFLDVAVLSTPKESPENLMERLLYYEPFFLYASKGHPLLKQNAPGPNELAKHAITLLHETHCMRDQVLAACGRGNPDSEERIRLAQGSLQTLVAIVESTRSFTLLPALSEPYLQLRHRRSGLRHLGTRTPVRKISLVYSRAFGRRSHIEALHSVIRDCLPKAVTTDRPAKVVVVEPDERHFRGRSG